MFRFLELELHGWDFWPSFRVPLDADIVVLSGPNGSGKTTLLDAIRQILHAPKLSQHRRLPHYLRQPNRPALLRAVVSNRPDGRGRRPFDRQRVFSEEATLACALVPNGGSPEKRFVVVAGRPAPEELQKQLLEGRDWLGPDEYRRVLEYAGLSRSLLYILALEQGRADELSRLKPRELFRWVMEARGSQQVLDRYTGARRQYDDSAREVERQRRQLSRHQSELEEVERKVRRLEEYEDKVRRVKQAEDIVAAAHLQELLIEMRQIDGKLPELRTKITNMATTIDRLKREIGEKEKACEVLGNVIRLDTARAREATETCDKAVAEHAVLAKEVDSLRRKAEALAALPEEDAGSLEDALRDGRADDFATGQRHDQLQAALREIEARIADLDKGISRFPAPVERTTAALAERGVNVFLAAGRVEVLDNALATAVESALGSLRYALCVSRDDEEQAAEIAREHGFPGPIVCELSTDGVVSDCLRVEPGAPSWLGPLAASLRRAQDDLSPGNDDIVISPDGNRRDRYGLWVWRASDRVLGGGAIRAQLEAARDKRGTLLAELAEADRVRLETACRVTDLENRLEAQRRREGLIGEVAILGKRELELHGATEELARRRMERDRVQSELREAENNAIYAATELERIREKLAEDVKSLDGTRATAGEMEKRRGEIEPLLNELIGSLDPALKAKAEGGDLPSREMATRDHEGAKRSLSRLEEEGPIPDGSVREEKKVLLRNVEELEAHVRDRESEAEAAARELDRCRGDYLEVVRGTLHDYAKRSRALAEMASARLEVDLPRLENDDRSIDEAGIVVRIGFDGKPPTEIGDTSHSGGQQVVSGLVLLMAMAETEGESFFIIDEPFAHLSLDRVDDVGKFLRRSGAQFLLTVPTTLDRGQLDSASLLIVLRKKGPSESHAPRPVVARA